LRSWLRLSLQEPVRPGDQDEVRPALPGEIVSGSCEDVAAWNNPVVDFLIVGNGMFGAAAARYLAPHALVTAIGPPSSAGGIGDYGAHHDEGRIIGDFSRDEVRSELNRLARAGITTLDPDLIVRCGVLTATASNSPDLAIAARVREQHGTDISVLTSGEATARYPMTAFGSGEAVLSQPDAGYFSPRRYVALCLQSARSRGATVIPGIVQALRITADGVEARLEDGRQVRAGTAIVANGAFAAGSGLLPRPVALRARSEIYIMAEVDERQAASELAAMPCVKRTIEHPELADLYVIPPIRYPDGHFYIKAGANTTTDEWLTDPAAVRAWYDHGHSDGPLSALRELVTSLLPGIRFSSWQTRRCGDAHTAHAMPYIDVLEPGRLIVALGGNGRGARHADAVGQLTAGLALSGEWQSSLPRDVFRHVPAGTGWTGMPLLREQRR
jgi:sarcosine oxidase